MDQSAATEETKAILVEGEDQEFINREMNLYDFQHNRMVVMLLIGELILMILNCSTQTRLRRKLVFFSICSYTLSSMAVLKPKFVLGGESFRV